MFAISVHGVSWDIFQSRFSAGLNPADVVGRHSAADIAQSTLMRTWHPGHPLPPGIAAGELLHGRLQTPGKLGRPLLRAKLQRFTEPDHHGSRPEP